MDTGQCEAVHIIKVRIHYSEQCFLDERCPEKRDNQTDRKDLVIHILQLLDPIGNRQALQNQKVSDIGLRVKEDALPSVTAVLRVPIIVKHPKVTWRIFGTSYS